MTNISAFAQVNGVIYARLKSRRIDLVATKLVLAWTKWVQISPRKETEKTAAPLPTERRTTLTSATPMKPFLNWKDVAEIFGCGRSKAQLLMQEVGVVYIGHAAFVRADDLDAYLNEHGSIEISWPKSKARREARRSKQG